MSTDTDWEKWGAKNPYFGVLSDKKFLGKKLDTKLQKEFYKSGADQVGTSIEKLRQLTGKQKLHFYHAVDFGCGVGRLSVALTEYSKKVTALDVSPSMITTARSNTPKNLQNKISYKIADNKLAVLPAKYDLLYSCIVFQHIPTSRGMKILSKLLNNLENHGCAVIQITYNHKASKSQKIAISLKQRFNLVRRIFNIARSKRENNTPLMRMYCYDLEDVLETFQINNVNSLELDFTNHGGYLGVVITAKKFDS